MQRGKVFSKKHSQTPIATVTASIFENGRFWNGCFTVAPEDIIEFGSGAESRPEFVIELDDGRQSTFVENRREVRMGERGFRLHVMGTRALQYAR